MTDTKKVTPIRERQTEMTRMAILEAIAEIIVEDGLLGFAVQNVADRAGVSHRTVYRYFPTREAMCEGVIEWYEERPINSNAAAFPTTLDRYVEMIPIVFAEFDADRMLFQSLILLSLSTGFRAGASRRRDKQMENMIRELAPTIPEQDRKRAVVLARYLGASHSWMSLTTQYDQSHVEAAEVAIYGIRLVLQDLKRLERKAKKQV